MNLYGLVDKVGVWKSNRTAHNQVYNAPPARGAFSPTKKTGTAILGSNGQECSLFGAGSALSDQSVTGSSAYAVEFTVVALGATLQVGLVDATNAGTTTVYGDAPHFDSAGTELGTFNSIPSTTFSSTAWSVGDKIGITYSVGNATFYRNGTKLHTFQLSATAARFFAAASATGPQITAETIVELMTYGTAYALAFDSLLDWPIAATFVDSPATQVTITPNLVSGFLSVAQPFTVAVNGSLTSTCNVVVSSNDGTDTLSTTTFALTNIARSGTFNDTATATGSKVLSCTNDKSLTNVSSNFVVTSAPAVLKFDSTRRFGSGSFAGTMSNSDKTITSGATINDQASVEGVGQVRQGDATVGAGYVVEFNVDALPTGAKLGYKIIGGGSYNSGDIDPDFAFNTLPYFHQDGAWAINGSTSGSSTAWVVGDKIGLLVYDIADSTGYRLALFRNGTLIGHGLAATSVTTILFAQLAKTTTAAAVGATLQGDISSMTYGSTYAAYRDVASVQTMVDAVGWPGSDVLEKLATTYTLNGPASGATGAASTNFTVAVSRRLAAPVVVTPAGTVGTNVFSPTTVTLTDTSRTGTFTDTPAIDGTHVVSTTNGGGLTDPSTVSYASTTMSGDPELTNQDYTTFGPLTTGGTYSAQGTVAFLPSYLEFDIGSTGAAIDLYIAFGYIPTSTSFDYHVNSSGTYFVIPGTRHGPGVYHVLAVATGTVASGGGRIYYEADP